MKYSQITAKPWWEISGQEPSCARSPAAKPMTTESSSLRRWNVKPILSCLYMTLAAPGRRILNQRGEEVDEEPLSQIGVNFCGTDWPHHRWHTRGHGGGHIAHALRYKNARIS